MEVYGYAPNAATQLRKDLPMTSARSAVRPTGCATNAAIPPSPDCRLNRVRNAAGRGISQIEPATYRRWAHPTHMM